MAISTIAGLTKILTKLLEKILEKLLEKILEKILEGQGATGEGWGRFSFRLSTMYTDTRMKFLQDSAVPYMHGVHR